MTLNGTAISIFKDHKIEEIEVSVRLICIPGLMVDRGAQETAPTPDTRGLKDQVSAAQATADAAKAEAAAARQEAADAKALAGQAMSTANEAKATSEETETKIDRMFKKAMYK